MAFLPRAMCMITYFGKPLPAAGAGAAAAIASEKFIAELENRAYPGN